MNQNINQTVIITGACGELGSSLIRHLEQFPEIKVVAIDLSAPVESSKAESSKAHGHSDNAPVWYQGDVTDAAFLNRIVEEHSAPTHSTPSSSVAAPISTFFHFASILSTGGEKNPARAHSVNVIGGYNILEAARISSILSGSTVKVIFPSTIAVYGVPSSDEASGTRTTDAPAPLQEDQHLSPITMYGVTKLHLERLGSYFSSNFGMLIDPAERGSVDFRSLRYPGLLCAKTVPTGGTSDYGAEMLHAAAQGKPYSCFVRPETRLPFMTMPDALRALLGLWRADRQQITRTVYNVNGFSASAAELRDEVLAHFTSPDFNGTHLDYNITPGRQLIVDSWPDTIDDSAARQDWGWAPKFDLQAAFAEYLVPEVKDFYQRS